MTHNMEHIQAKYNDQARLLISVVSHQKNPAVNKSTLSGHEDRGEDMAREESMRADRIARQMNRSSFMGLGENPPRLMSEQDPTQQQRGSLVGPGSGGVMMNSNNFHDKDQSYLTDESVPSGIYALIDTYRQKARSTRPGD